MPPSSSEEGQRDLVAQWPSRSGVVAGRWRDARLHHPQPPPLKRRGLLGCVLYRMDRALKRAQDRIMMAGYRIAGLLSVAMAAAVIAAPAQACSNPGSQTSMLHTELPNEDAGDFAAEVEVTVSQHGPGQRSFEGRIIRLLRGTTTATTFRLDRSTINTSCDSYPSVGSKGILVGTIVSSSPDEVSIKITHAPSSRQLERLKAASTN